MPNCLNAVYVVIVWNLVLKFLCLVSMYARILYCSFYDLCRDPSVKQRCYDNRAE